MKRPGSLVASLVAASSLSAVALLALRPALAAPEIVVPFRPVEFINSTPITINDAAVAAPYPSTINVVGMFGVIWDVRVDLFSYTHGFPDDVDILLVDPAGRSLVLMSDSGGGNNANNFNLRFDDHADVAVPSGPFLKAKSYRPSNQAGPGTDGFPPPAPAAPYGQPGPVGDATLTSTFAGVSPNGTWSLYVVDDAGGGGGSIAGWALIFTEGFRYPGGAITINDSAAPPTTATPYPSTISVAGLPPHLADVKVEFTNFMHDFPDDVDMLLVAPNGEKFVPMSDYAGNNGVTGIDFTLEDQARSRLDTIIEITNGRYLPADTNNAALDSFPAPAPAGPYPRPFPAGGDSFHSAFDRVDPNGIWSLYVVDDANVDGGSIGSWALILTPYSEFNNFGAITIGDAQAASPYPSNIPVGDAGDAAGTLAGAFVKVNGLTHTFPGDVDMMLVDPFDRALLVQSDAGTTNDVTNISYRLDDVGVDLLPDSGTIVDGSTYYPTNWGTGDTFPLPAPQSGVISPITDTQVGFRSTFRGGVPNGVWKLFIVDDAGNDSGNIANGWTLGILTVFDPILIDSFDDVNTD